MLTCVVWPCLHSLQISRVKLLGHIVSLCLTFKEMAKLSKVQSYIPTSSAQVFQFTYILTKTQHCLLSKILLESSWFITCINFFCTAAWLSYTYIYFLLWLVRGSWVCFPVLYSRTLFIHAVYNSLPLLISNSHSFPPYALSAVAAISLFFIWVCFIYMLICILF